MPTAWTSQLRPVPTPALIGARLSWPLAGCLLVVLVLLGPFTGGHDEHRLDGRASLSASDLMADFPVFFPLILLLPLNLRMAGPGARR